ncbi:3,4-dihydroxy-2-butanone-4-phosphate synthase [Rhodococcus sp. APC 3903]|uniref:3,4-dihydroxy-2-butanone-4-phosphate synthase n=1 Tax=Rhodococcus sp. APC 3903 TaxID=3035193 RepID=UPI0025B3242E|nr:3,4-dihydroxy-2-butanone-4-phosphate synthase [Rhodococcus sp. APC 3903]MDN3460868.1 3,4-dihydroxy-2-butanone-4-phosphate synthase [Rhodococcus sp. APC 3903]
MTNDLFGSDTRSAPRGTPILVIDDRSASGEHLLVLPAEAVNIAAVAFLIRHGSGFLRTALTEDRCEELLLLPQWVHRQEVQNPYCVTVDAAEGITTGISAADRTATIQQLLDPCAGAADFHRPGHVVPIRIRQDDQNVNAETSVVDILANSEIGLGFAYDHLIDSDDGEVATILQANTFAARFDLPVLRLSALVRKAAGRSRVTSAQR